MQVDINRAEGTKHAAEDGLEEGSLTLSSTNSFLLKQEAIHLQGVAKL